MKYFYTYHFGSLGPWQYRHVSDEEKLEIAKAKAAKDMANYIIEHFGVFKINECGDVEGVVEIP